MHYNGLVEQIKMEKLHFVLVVLLFLYVKYYFHKPNKKTINNVLTFLNEDIKNTEIILIAIFVIVMFIIFLLISKIYY